MSLACITLKDRVEEIEAPGPYLNTAIKAATTLERFVSLEVSTFGSTGKWLSPFLLKQTRTGYTMESLYQGSKVFANHPNNTHLYAMSGKAAKIAANELHKTDKFIGVKYNNVNFGFDLNRFHYLLFNICIFDKPNLIQLIKSYRIFTNIFDKKDRASIARSVARYRLEQLP